MPSPREARAVLQGLTANAIATAAELLARAKGSPEARRLVLLNDAPEIIDYYADGSAALAADFYEEQRELAGIEDRFTAELVLVDRTVKVRRAIAWAAQPLFDANDPLALSRLGEVVQMETARPFRDTVLSNSQRDPESVGWRRIARPNGCSFCRMLADRGAVYRGATVRFASHGQCHCVAQPVFSTNDTGETASVEQYTASRRNRTPAQRDALRAFLNDNY